jgi:hypothetical protein
MSLKIENVAIDAAVLAVAGILEDLGAASRHKIAIDNHKARHTLAAWIRDKHAELQQTLSGLSGINGDELKAMLNEASQFIRSERAHLARVARERREALQAEREALLAEFGDEAIAA